MLKNKILDLLNRSNFMTLSTSVAGNSSAANVYFAMLLCGKRITCYKKWLKNEAIRHLSANVSIISFDC